MTTILDGKKLADTILEKCREKISRLPVKPVLAVILIGDNEASHLYVTLKEKACAQVGIHYQKHIFETSTTPEIVSLIRQLNDAPEVQGILVQLPLPDGLDKHNILSAIALEKDVDFLSPRSFGQLLTDPDAGPCTPRGIIRMLDEYNIELAGKSVCIINHSDLIGKPLSLLLLNRKATVAVCHDQTNDLFSYTKEADIVISATGVPGLITKDHVKEGVVIIDAGIKKTSTGVVGDVHSSVQEKASYFTPVPGGVGPMTVVMLVEKMVLLTERSLQKLS